MSKLIDVQQYGQSIWMDYIHRKDLQSGALQTEIDAGVLGVTSNPAIFQNAIGNSDIYDEEIRNIDSDDTSVIYETLAIKDIQDAADLFLPVYERTNKIDGYISLEVSPRLAHDTEGTIAEAKRLFEAVGRPNICIKIPSTQAGIPAIEAVIAAGINVNVTLIFSVENYEQVAEAFIRGLETRLEKGEDVTGIASVASFFLSRIDVMVDDLLGDGHELRGLAALASSKLAYQSFERIFLGERFATLREAGAQVQRPLWASTGTKNPAYPDTLYVDPVIGKHTVNTIPPKTLDAFKDHGTVGETIYDAVVDDLSPRDVMEKLASAGIDMDDVTAKLQDEGVDKFIQAFDTLLSQIREKAEKVS